MRLHGVFWTLFILASTSALAQSTPPEESAPAATTSVQQLIDQSIAASNRGDATRALALADAALSAARQVDDAAGQAGAHRLRAQQLVKLSRSPDAISEWRAAEAAWARLGDGPGQVEAIGWQAVLLTSQTGSDAAQMLERAIASAELELKRPRATVDSLVEIGRAFLDRSRLTEGRRVFTSAVGVAERSVPGSLELAAGLNGLGSSALYSGDLKTAGTYYARALAIREKVAPDSLLLARTFNNLGVVAWRQGNLTAARQHYERALAIQQKLEPDAMDVAASLGNLGIIAHDQGDVQAAIGYQREALAISRKRSPDSLQVATALHNLGVALSPVDRTGAGDRFREALAIREKLVPDSLDVATTLTALGTASDDLGLAAEYHERAVAIFAKIAPESPAAVSAISNLGAVALLRGELAEARRYQLRALAIAEKTGTRTLNVASILEHLGVIAKEQGDLAGAADYQRQSLDIREGLASESLSVAGNLNNLGILARMQGNLAAARDYHSRALAIREKVAPDSLVVAQSLSNLGTTAQDAGDMRNARMFHERALVLQTQLAPESLTLAIALENWFSIARELDQQNADVQPLDRAVAIRERLAPSSLGLASSLAFRGKIAHERGDIDAAIKQTERAWAIVREQSTSVAGDEASQAFFSQYLSIAGQLVRLRIAKGNIDLAFTTLEEGRAQALLKLITERGVARRLAPRDVWRQYEIAQAASNRAGKALEHAGAAAAKARLALDAESAQKSPAHVLDDTRRIVGELDKSFEDARQVYTRLRIDAEQRWARVTESIDAAVSQPLAAGDARRYLPEGAVLAAFALSAEGSTLFLVARDGPTRAFPLPISLEQLTARVKFVRETTSREAGSRGLAVQGADEIRVAAARGLFAQLFPPEAWQAIARAKRLLLSPDGVLWNLPFAALVINEQGKPRYLGLETPLTYTQSLAAFARSVQREAATPPRKPSVLIVGNPLYDNALRPQLTTSTRATAQASIRVASAKTRAAGELALLSREGDIPAPLPYAGEEANQIAALYGVRASTGVEPTEAWFRQRAADADVIHLATHGYFNEFRAASSGVRLAVPEKPGEPGETNNDGALQAWEVFTQLQLRANIVVLSACETGVGAQVPGEGLVGLTRAFQVAGAASIVATQWRVADRSTAGGMVAFHQALRKGLPKDKALALAMQKLAADPTTSHPSYWAPFVLIGDFRAAR